MNSRVRTYKTAGRATQQTSSNKDAATYMTGIHTHIVCEPGSHKFRIQIGEDEYFTAIKLHRGDIHRLQSALSTHSSHDFINNGQAYTELQPGDTSRQLETDHVYCQITPYENRGLAIQIGGSNICGAEALFTPKQRDDFERVLNSFKNNQNGFTPLFDNGSPQIVSPNGTLTPI